MVAGLAPLSTDRGIGDGDTVFCTVLGWCRSVCPGGGDAGSGNGLDLFSHRLWLGVSIPAGSFIPAARALVPRPGNWMNSFKKLMGFSLLGAAVWLYGVISEQLIPAAATMVLAGLVLTGFASWIYAL